MKIFSNKKLKDPSSLDMDNKSSTAQEKKAGIFLSLIAMLILMACITSVGLWGMELIREKAEIIVKNRLDKVRLVTAMRAAARERTVILQRMIMMDDPFERDDEFMRFNHFGAKFLNNRIEFQKHILDSEETLILERQGTISKIAVPLQDNIIDMIVGDEIDKARDILAQEAVPLQDKVLIELNQLLDFQFQAADTAIKEAENAYAEGRFWILLMSSAAAFIGLVITIIVNKRANIAKQQREDYVTQVLDATKAKSAFLANMSHEIRTPLTGIIGFAELSLNPSQSKSDRIISIRNIVSSGKHLLSIINDILDLSKIEADKLEVEKIEMSPLEVLEDVKSIASLQAAEKGIEFFINYIFPLPKKICNDPLRLKQILINLCSNAIKFTEQGVVHINVSADTHNEKMRFEVIDSGIGLSKEQLTKIFEAFGQADASTTRRFGGTGLGLSLSKNLSVKLGGDISVESQLGVGSKFCVSIKTGKIRTSDIVFRIDNTPKNQDEIITNFENLQLSGTILIAEDTPINQTLLEMYLGNCGATLTFVENGKLAVDAATQTTYDLVLMDMQMPIMDGLTATKKLRSINYKGPIVALTANAMREDIESCKAAGCNEFISKPIDIKKLELIVVKYLEKTKNSFFNHEPINSSNKITTDKMLNLQKRFIKEGIPEFLGEIEAAYKSNNTQKLKEYLHKMKGTGGNFGYSILTEHCTELETLLNANNLEQMEAQISELSSICTRIIAGISTLQKRSA